jgi:hypothetical protein
LFFRVNCSAGIDKGPFLPEFWASSLTLKMGMKKNKFLLLIILCCVGGSAPAQQRGVASGLAFGYNIYFNIVAPDEQSMYDRVEGFATTDTNVYVLLESLNRDSAS